VLGAGRPLRNSSPVTGSTSRPTKRQEPAVDTPHAAIPLEATVTSTAGPRRDEGGLCWSTIAGLGFIHVGALAGLVWIVIHPSLATIVAALIAYAISGVAITAGYHRLFAHRTYRASAPVRWWFLATGAATFQNSALSWSADHRAHHAHTDTDGDPHAITRGAWFAHVGWLFRRREASADVTRLGDLWAVRSIRWQHRWYAAIAIGLGLVLPALIATLWGDPVGGLLVVGLLRAAVLLQATFCINSLAHLVGRRSFDESASARNSTLTALVTFGEGYHSYHHRFPFDFRNGIRWWQYDPSKWLITGLAKLGLVTDLRRASSVRVDAAVGSRPVRPAERDGHATSTTGALPR
jgi:stearoyl-CoA desaturase (delta-9 desaturase)